jgi:hypothetical protein
VEFVRPEGGYVADAARNEDGQWRPTVHNEVGVTPYDAAYSLAYASDRVNATHEADKDANTVNEMSQFMTDVNQARRRDPEAFLAWQIDPNNREDVIRYHGLNATGFWNGAAGQDYQRADGTTGTYATYEEEKALAQHFAYQEAQDRGFGEDGKEDGKMIAYDFDTFQDVQREGGGGDIWKIGNASSLPGGINDFVEENPWKALGMVGAAIVAPQLAGYLSTLGAGMSPALAAGLSNGIMAGLQGGDLEQILMSGGMGALTSFGMEQLKNTGGLDNIFGSPEYTLQGPDGTNILDQAGNPITVMDPNAHGALPEGLDGTWVPDKTFSMPDVPEWVQNGIDKGFEAKDAVVDIINGDPDLEGTGDVQIGDDIEFDPNGVPQNDHPVIDWVTDKLTGQNGQQGQEGQAPASTDVTPIASAVDPSYEHEMTKADTVGEVGNFDWTYNPNGMMNT